MAASLALRKTNRIITPKEVFTPTKYEMPMSYELNERKAMLKKIEATERDHDINIELKRGTIVMTFTPATYEIYKQAIYTYYQNHPGKICQKTSKTSRTNNASIEKATTEESLSIKPKSDSSRCGHGRQLYRINMFNTTSTMDVNGRQYQMFISEDMPEIIKSVDITGVSQLNSRLKELCEAILSTQDENNYHAGNEKALDIENKTKAKLDKRQSHNKQQRISCNQNDNENDINTLELHRKELCKSIIKNINKEICVKEHQHDEQDKVDEHKKDSLCCPICLNEITEQDCIECSVCYMWIHKLCSSLTQEQFNEQLNNSRLTYSCPPCQILDDEFTQYELESDREGTNATNNSSRIQSYDQTELKSIQIDNNQEHHYILNQSPKIQPKEQTEIKTTVQNDAVNICHNQNETELKKCELETPIIEKMHSPRLVEKQKLKQHKKKEKLEHDQQLAACKTRIIILEEQNREYENTIDLIHRKWRQDNTNTRKEEIQNIHYSSIDDLKQRMKEIEDSITNRLTTMNIEFQHKMAMQELNLKHEMEVRELRSEINMMKWHTRNKYTEPYSNNHETGQTSTEPPRMRLAQPPAYHNVFGSQQYQMDIHEHTLNNPGYYPTVVPAYRQPYNHIGQQMRFQPPGQIHAPQHSTFVRQQPTQVQQRMHIHMQHPAQIHQPIQLQHSTQLQEATKVHQSTPVQGLIQTQQPTREKHSTRDQQPLNRYHNIPQVVQHQSSAQQTSQQKQETTNNKHSIIQNERYQQKTTGTCPNKVKMRTIHESRKDAARDETCKNLEHQKDINVQHDRRESDLNDNLMNQTENNGNGQNSECFLGHGRSTTNTFHKKRKSL